MHVAQANTPMRSGSGAPGKDDPSRFLLVERPAIPWTQAIEDWSPADRVEYERARRRSQAVVLLDGGRGEASIRAPAVLRESLLSIFGESPEDEVVRRELGWLCGGAPSALSGTAHPEGAQPASAR